MGPRRSAPPALPPLPAKLFASLHELALDLREPALTAAFLDGVRVAGDAIAAEARWKRVRCKPTHPRRG